MVVLVLNILGGLVIGFIMKYMDNVVRNIIGSLALVTVTVASALVLHNEMTLNFLIGAGIVILGAQLYIWGRKGSTTSPSDENSTTAQIKRHLQQYKTYYAGTGIFLFVVSVLQFSSSLFDSSNAGIVIRTTPLYAIPRSEGTPYTKTTRPSSTFCGGDMTIQKGLNDEMCRNWNGKLFQETVSISNSLLEQSPVRLQYERYVDLPQGLQDGHGYFVDDWIVTTTGFCGGNFENNHVTPYCCGKRGFLMKTLVLDTLNPNNKWISIEDFPGQPRQGMGCSAINTELYCWGGYSYKPASGDATIEELAKAKEKPFGYMNGYKLSYTRKLDTQGRYRKAEWKWSSLPDMPLPQSAGPGSCTDGKRIYLVGGADYDYEQFHTNTDRYGKQEKLGSSMVSFDPSEGTWKIHSKFPGTPRFNAAVACVDNKVYVMGGITGGNSRPGFGSYQPIIDSWVYHDDDTWSRLPDGPVDAANIGMRGIVPLKNRYLLMIGAAYTADRAAVGRRESLLGSARGVVASNPTKQTFDPNVMQIAVPTLWLGSRQSTLVLAFDIQTNKYFFVDPLPMDNNGMFVVADDKRDVLYGWGGESNVGCFDGQAYGIHTNLVLKMKVSIGKK